jgi:hypothetical protein
LVSSGEDIRFVQLDVTDPAQVAGPGRKPVGTGSLLRKDVLLRSDIVVDDSLDETDALRAAGGPE